jgi:hypothetical protein
MFGSSEDRARQLAYRTRKERVVSSGSPSIRRSVSSASRHSKQSIQDLSTQPVTPSEPFGRQIETTGGEGCTSLEPSEHQQQILPVETTSTHPDDPLPTRHDLQEEQHRRQAEYLSEVLYSSLPLASLPRSTDGLFPAAFVSGVYGIFEPLPSERNATESVTPSASVSSLLDNYVHVQPTASLRGGAGSNESAQNENRIKRTTTTPSQGGSNKFPPAGLFNLKSSGPALYQQLWPWPASPGIIVNPSLERERFMRTLPPFNVERFTVLFGPALPHNVSELHTIRWHFCRSLDQVQRAALANIIEDAQPWNPRTRQEELARLLEGMHGGPPGPPIPWHVEHYIVVGYLQARGYSTLNIALTMFR